MALGHTDCDRADSGGGYEFHSNPGAPVDALEVEDELGKVLDRVDVVMRRRTDQGHARYAAAQAGDLRVHLEARDLPALARLAALGHLYLDLGSVRQVVGADPEPPAGDLLDATPGHVSGPGIPGLAVRQVGPVTVVRFEALRVLASLSRVALCAQPVHGDGDGLVGLARDAAVAHRLGGEARDDRLDRLDLCQWHGLLAPGVIEQVA